jgi:hypothetical protein
MEQDYELIQFYQDMYDEFDAQEEEYIAQHPEYLDQKQKELLTNSFCLENINN